MRVVFLGTPEFALPSLAALAKSHDVVACVCQPDRERDRRGNILPCAVKRAAAEAGIPVLQYEKIRLEGSNDLLGLHPDLMVTCAYGQILSKEILDIPRCGVLNVHGSLLPRYRGAAPVQRAIMNGETVTGVTIMKTDEGMDTGAILSAAEVKIGDDEYADELFGRLGEAGAELLVSTIEDYVSGRIKPVPQDDSLASYAPMLKREDFLIDFSLPAKVVRDRVRGAGSGTVAFRGAPLKVYRLDLAAGEGEAGVILGSDKHGITVACGFGAVTLTEVQASGKRRMSAADYALGARIKPGESMERIK